MKERVIDYLERNCDGHELNNMGNIVYNFGPEQMIVEDENVVVGNSITLNFRFYTFEEFLRVYDYEM